MPSVLEDPSAPLQPRVSPFTLPPLPTAPFDASSLGIVPRTLQLRDSSPATLLPLARGAASLPPSLVAHLAALLNAEIAAGDTYPMTTALSPAAFGAYWAGNFTGLLVAGHIPLDFSGVDPSGCGPVERALFALHDACGGDWAAIALGTFYVKPNYPGRSSHVCNAGFLVGGAARGKGVGRLMGEAYLDWASRLGYVYSIFNLVYETNPASMRIWDALGFERVGRVKGAGNLAGSPGKLVDAIVYGRELRVGEELPGLQKAVEEVGTVEKAA